jgi:hypothetical protein
MATRTRTYKTTDWSVWTFVPEADSFVLDFSQLDGTDVLGLTSGSMQQLDIPISAISLSEGGQPGNSILPTVQPQSLDVSLSIKDFTRSDTQKFYVGKPIWLTLTNAQTIGATTYGFETPWFVGVIRDFQVTLDPSSDFADINIQATSNATDWLNYQLSLTKNTTDGKDVVFNYAMAADPDAPLLSWGYGPPDYPESPYNYANTATEIKTMGEWIDDAINSDQPIYRDQFFIATSASPGYVTYLPEFKGKCYTQDFSLTFDSSTINSIEYGWDSNDAPTAVSLTLANDSEIVYNTQKPAQDSLGSVNFSTSIDVKNLTQLSLIGQKLIGQNKSYAVVSFTDVLAQDNLDLVYRDIRDFGGAGTDYAAWLYPYQLANIGEVITIDLPDYGFEPQQSVVVGRTIEVTYTNVLVTYQLWKGFTN